MQFLNPFVLFGLIASVIPLIIHILNLRKVKTVEFSTIRFLNELQKSSIKKLKIKQILLLIIRTLLIIFLILAFSRPAIKSYLPILGEYSKNSIVILLDNSPSMDFSDEYGVRFTQAKNIAKELISNLKSGDEVAVLPLSPKELNDKHSLTRDLNLIAEQVNKITISNYKADLNNALRKAQSVLDESKNLIKEIYIISDFQKNNIHNLNDSIKLFDANTTLYCLPIGLNSKVEFDNISVDSVYINSTILQPEKPIEINFTVNNYYNKKQEGVVVSTIINKEKMAQRSFDLEALESKSLSLSSNHKSNGLFAGYIELENDIFEYDNKKYFGYVIPEKPKVGIIGDKIITKYIKLILELDNNQSVEIINSNISSLDLNKYDMIFTAGPYSTNDFRAIADYIKNGRGAFIFPNNENEIEIFKQGLIILGISSNYRASPNQEVTIRRIDKLHPIFYNVFKNPNDDRLQIENPKLNKYISLSGGQSIIALNDGDLLTEIKYGTGKALVFGVTPDDKWSNIPKTTIFPSIIYRAQYYLSLKEVKNISVPPSYSFIFEVPQKLISNKNYKLISPDGAETFYNSTQIGNKELIEIKDLFQIGNYLIINSNNNYVAIISVNHDISESNIEKIEKDNILKSLNSILNENANKLIIEDVNNLQKELIRTKSGTELWQLFVILAIIMALLELLVQRLYKNE